MPFKVSLNEKVHIIYDDVLNYNELKLAILNIYEVKVTDIVIK